MATTTKMKKPKPVYETPWLETGFYSFGHRRSQLSLCRPDVDKMFEIPSGQRIKIALFNCQVDNSAKIKRVGNSLFASFEVDGFASFEVFEVDGVLTTFGAVSHDRLVRVLKQHGTDTLYAKCYIEA